MSKTNAARVLDGLGIAYSVRAYDVDEDDLSAETVAMKVGLPAEQVYKTLVLKSTGSTEHIFAIIAADRHLDLKATAKAAGLKGVEPVPVKALVGLTGYIRGGVTVFAAKKAFPVVVDELMPLHEEVSVSAGQRGLQLIMNPADYIRASAATVAAISRDQP